MALGLTPQQIIDKGTHPQLVIADDWKRVELKLIATVQNGFAFSSKLFNHNEGLPLIRIRDIFSTVTQNLYSGEYSEDFLVSNGDILIGMDGDFKVSKWPGKKGLLNQRVCRIHFSSKYYEKEFLFLCIQPYLDAIHSETSAVTVKHLSSRTLNDIPFPLPPLVEQKAIVNKIEELFSSLDSGIADLKKAQDQLVIYRQAVLKKAFEGELTKEWREKQTNLPSADELLEQIKEESQKHYDQQLADWKEAVKIWEGNKKEGKKPKKPTKIKDLPSLSKDEIELEVTIPRNWTYVKIGNVTDSIVPNRDKPKSFNGDIHWLTTPNLNLNSIKIDYNFIEKGLTKEECTNYNARIIPINSVIMTCVGMLGTSSIIEQEVVINQQLHAFTPSNSYIPKYLAYLIRFNKSYLERSSAATTVQYLNKTKCNSIPFPLCSKQEQHQIVSDIESRLSVCDTLEKDIADSLEKAQALRQSILKKAFEGKLLSEAEIAKCKADAAYEPASVLLEKIKAEKKK